MYLTGAIRTKPDYMENLNVTYNYDVKKLLVISLVRYIRWCIQKFPDWPPGARTANGLALCYQVQLYRYFVSQSSEFCRNNHSCYFSASVCCCKRIFRYRLSPETFGYTLVIGFSMSRRWKEIYTLETTKIVQTKRTNEPWTTFEETSRRLRLEQLNSDLISYTVDDNLIMMMSMMAD